MMNNKVTKVLEYAWLTIALLCLFGGIHKTLRVGFKDSYLFFVFTAVALIMYLLRRALRKSKKQ